MGIELFHHPIGQVLPAPIGMRVGLSGLHGQHSIEQQDALLGPMLQKTVVRHHESRNVVAQFPVDIAQRRRNIHAPSD